MNTWVGRPYPLYCAEDRSRPVEADGVAQLVSRGVGGDVGGRRLLHADRDEDEAAILVALGQVAQDRHLRLAGRAPGGPEVDPDGLATKVGEADRRALEVGQLVRGAVGVGDGQLRSRRTDLEPLGRRRRDDVGGRLRIDRARSAGGVAERRVHADQHDAGDQDRRRIARTSCRPLNGPITPWRSRLWLNSGRVATQTAVLKLK